MSIINEIERSFFDLLFNLLIYLTNKTIYSLQPSSRYFLVARGFI